MSAVKIMKIVKIFVEIGLNKVCDNNKITNMYRLNLSNMKMIDKKFKLVTAEYCIFK